MRKQQHEVAYEQIAKEAARFASMVADFPKFGSGDFLKRYPDYAYDGTDYIVHRARALAVSLTRYANEQRSGQMRETEKAQAAQVQS